VGEWKAQVSVRIRQTLRAEIEEFAARERRTMSNISELLLDWSIAHLKKAGTIDQLLGTLPCAKQSQDDTVTARRTTEKDGVMVPQRFQMSLRIGPALRSEIEAMAKREHHTFGRVATLLLEWGYEQLKAAGTTERLRQCGIAFRDDKAQPIRAMAESRADEPKMPIAPTIREEAWKGMKEIAIGEDKRLSELAGFVLEWSALQLSAIGSTDRLLNYRIRPLCRQDRPSAAAAGQPIKTKME
jgi:hypothetical protein